MDCQMPIMDGFTATQKIRESKNVYSNIPIIAVTANAMEKDKEACLKSGMNDYLKKPVAIHDLKKKIAQFQWLNISDEKSA